MALSLSASGQANVFSRLSWDLANMNSSGDDVLFPAVVQKEENPYPGQSRN